MSMSRTSDTLPGQTAWNKYLTSCFLFVRVSVTLLRGYDEVSASCMRKEDHPKSRKAPFGRSAQFHSITRPSSVYD
jgi:hypothetical protein